MSVAVMIWFRLFLNALKNWAVEKFFDLKLRLIVLWDKIAFWRR